MDGIEKFKVKVKIPVRWGDMDAFQHVNNTIYLRWNECARVEYLQKFVTGSFKKQILGPILARQDCRYISPVNFPDTVIVGIRTAEILEDRIRLETRIYSESNSKLCAIIYSTVMAYNFKLLRKAEIPKDWIDAIKSLDFK